MKLEITSNIPLRAGLAGSTAMVVAVLGGVLKQLGIDMSRCEIAETSRKIEKERMGILCGYQDQYMAVFGGVNFMDFGGKLNVVEGEPEPFAAVESLQDKIETLPLVIAHTGIQRNSGAVHGSIRSRWLAGEREVVESYERIAELARAGRDALLSADWKTLGGLMNENHAIQRDLGGSGEENERLIAAASGSGALGAKLAGAGQGGTIVALTLDRERTTRALIEADAEQVFVPQPSAGLTVEEITKSSSPQRALRDC